MLSKELVAGIVGAVVVFLVLHVINSRSNNCTVIITGESVTIQGCEFNKDFIDYARELKPAYHNFR